MTLHGELLLKTSMKKLMTAPKTILSSLESAISKAKSSTLYRISECRNFFREINFKQHIKYEQKNLLSSMERHGHRL